jgi:hypothetical protein
MKRLALTLLAAAGLTAVSARADHISVRGSVNIGGPAYVAPAPVYYPPAAPVYVAPAGYWRTIETNVWVPAHWEMTQDGWGRQFNRWIPGHTECRTQRVWVDAYAAHEWREYHGYGWDRDHDRDRYYRH